MPKGNGQWAVSSGKNQYSKKKDGTLIFKAMQ
jgi:hypothetical protein